MKTLDMVVYGSLFFLLILYMAYLSWRNGSLAAMLTAPFTDGGTEGVTLGVLMIAGVVWYIAGWNTAFMVVTIAIAIVWFIVGRRIERYHKQLRNVQ